MKTTRNTITAIVLMVAMLISLSSCLTAINVAGENGTDDGTEEIKDSGTEKIEETEENKETVSSNEGTDAINEPDSSEEEIFMNTDKETGRCPNECFAPKYIKTIDDVKKKNIPDDYPFQELIDRITDDFYGNNKDENHFLAYFFGNYNGAIPVKYEMGMYLCATLKYYVAGYEFSDAYCNDYIRVWKDGKFYNLQEAYEYGLLTEDEIGNIWWLCCTNNYIHVRDRLGFDIRNTPLPNQE